jgi:DNA modification methylase
VERERVSQGLSTRYSEDDSRDLGNITDYEMFLKELIGVFAECRRVLKPQKHLAAIVGDFRNKGRFHMFHSDLAGGLEDTGYVLKGITILYQSHKRLFP